MEIAKSAAEKANMAKSVFLHNMTHKLRTPVNGILGYSQFPAAEFLWLRGYIFIIRYRFDDEN